MRAYAKRSVALAIVGAVVWLSSRAVAQSASITLEPPGTHATEPNGEAPEEITVRGRRTLTQYRLEVTEAREELIEAFNDENSGTDNDVTCRDERPTGSRVPRRVCRSNAQLSAESAAARELLTTLLFNSNRPEGGAVNPGATAAGAAGARTARSRAEIEAELRRLARENPKVFRAAVKYIEAEDAYLEARAERTSNADSP